MPRRVQPKRPVPDPEARAAPKRPPDIPRAIDQTTSFDDDILIPPAREAKEWICDNCGRGGAIPDPGYLDIDPRYSVGTHDCQAARKGVKPRVPLIADFHFDRAMWLRGDLQRRRAKAFQKSVSGGKLSPEEIQLAAQFRIIAGLGPIE